MSVKTQRPEVKIKPRQVTAYGAAATADKPATRPVRALSTWQILAIAFGLALAAALIAYGPALRGEFVFDDAHMQFAQPHPERLSLAAWMGARPLVGASYWINYKMSGADPSDPFWYHVTNIFLHTIAALLVFLIVRKILELASIKASLRPGRGTLVAAFCAAIFLLHPIQTEAVAYVSSRSENLSVMFAFAAWTVFLYRRSRVIGMGTVALILLLFGFAATAKEHVAVLPVVILLTDYYWNPGFSLKGVWKNWRLYGVFAVAGMGLAAFLWSYLSKETTVGFHMQVAWYQYFFTQCRVLLMYLRLLILPFGQSADYAIQLSHTPFEHGAIFGMAALAAATAAAIVWRKRYPIASYGFFVAMIFFLPTSSIIPIKDLAAERRLYLPLIGLLLIAAQILVRTRANERQLAGALAAVVLLAGGLTWNRSHVWNNSLALWSDTVEKSPEQARAHFGLATAEYRAHRYAEAVQQYEQARSPEYEKDGMYYANWALALDDSGRLKDAIEKGRKAIEMTPNAITYSQQAMFLAKGGQIDEALQLLQNAEKADPSYVPIYIERGDILLALYRNDAAGEAFEKALSLDPRNVSAAKGLSMLRIPGAQ